MWEKVGGKCYPQTIEMLYITHKLQKYIMGTSCKTVTMRESLLVTIKKKCGGGGGGEGKNN